MAGELILIIEDNEKNRKLARDVLQVKGYQTIESETAEEGIELALAKSPALILMDIQLPGIDGITALKQLRAEPKTRAEACRLASTSFVWASIVSKRACHSFQTRSRSTWTSA